ncbi:MULTISPECIES: pyridoxamine 5'-phosphate oxidase family protein [unclassified Streptomyces]|uniref:pyridoxamine 5'-phosphate oxidase family protein n=1 Tax=unclassified Streptomyces TaxID=2593676 RepID=UPI003723923F
MVWFRREGDTVLFSSTDGRQKVRNLRRDPRVSLTVFDLANPYHSAEILPDDSRRLPYELAHKYLGRSDAGLRASRCAGNPGTASGTPRI